MINGFGDFQEAPASFRFMALTVLPVRLYKFE